jgi:drug/metabolite transporter (DMT)-like permease
LTQTILRNKTRLLGILSACTVVLIWSGWIVSSRWGITTHFSPIDLTWLRFATATVITLPLSLRYSWKTLPLRKALIISMGCGFPYVWLVYFALQLIPSANASVLINGFLPIATGVIAVLFLGTRITKVTLVFIVIIIFSSFLTALKPDTFSSAYVLGVALLVLASTILAIYMIAVKAWDIAIRDIMAWVPLINTIILLPFWLAYSKGIEFLMALPTANLLFHVVYQGLIVSVLALFLFSFAIKAIGAFATSLFMALVPTVTALIAMRCCNELPTVAQWLGITLCSLSLIGYCFLSSNKTQP